MVLRVSLGSYSERHIGHVLSFQLGKRPLSPMRVLGNFSISGPLRPIVGEERIMELGSSMLGRARWPWVYTSNLLHIKQQSPVKHRSPGIPTPIVKPYLALLERPTWNESVKRYQTPILNLYGLIESSNTKLTNSSSNPHTLFLHPHIIFLFHSCPSWNYINTPILIKPISFPTGWPSHPVYIFWKWEPDAPLIRFTISKNCKPDGLVIWLSKKIQTGRPHPVLNPADRKIFRSLFKIF